MTQEEFENKVQSIPDRKLIEMAERAIEGMCINGGKSFTMTVPPRIDDTDIVLSEIVRRFEERVVL